jgi:ribonuclease VapC
MILDTSAFLAIFFDEPEGVAFRSLVARAAGARMSAASYVEACLKVDRLDDPDLSAEVDTLIAALGIVIEPVSVQQAVLARGAYRRFGKGRHPAGLNFGDCLSYALAAEVREPLLFKGDDFARTDLPAVDHSTQPSPMSR